MNAVTSPIISAVSSAASSGAGDSGDVVHFYGDTIPTEGLILYTKPLVDSIGILSLVVISGSDQSDWVLTLPDSSTVTDILGVDNDFYSAGGVPLEMSWVEMQTAADGNVYFYAGRKGTALYSVDMSAEESTIMRALGGLYVLPIEFGPTWVDADTWDDSAIWTE